MRNRTRRSSSLRDVLTFWAMILVAAVILAVLGFAGGKYWIGGLLARDGGTTTAPEIALKTPGEDVNGTPGVETANVEPPDKAQIKIEQRDPTEAEKSEIDQGAPQDGAGLNSSGAGDETDASTGSDTKPLDEEADSARYTVTAGSFAKQVNADNEVADLTAKGYQPTVVKVARDGKTYNRVIVGSYSDRAEAEKVRDELAGEGKTVSISTR